MSINCEQNAKDEKNAKAHELPGISYDEETDVHTRKRKHLPLEDSTKEAPTRFNAKDEQYAKAYEESVLPDDEEAKVHSSKRNHLSSKDSAKEAPVQLNDEFSDDDCTEPPAIGAANTLIVANQKYAKAHELPGISYDEETDVHTRKRKHLPLEDSTKEAPTRFNAKDEQYAKAYEQSVLPDDAEAKVHSSKRQRLSSKDSAKEASDQLNNEFSDDDCTEPPAIGAANTHIVANHYNELKEAGRKERHKSKIFFMRNFNNWIKSQLINEYMSLIKKPKNYGDRLRVLDMCCGKGGDLLKWEKASISHLICTDIAEVSVEQCQRRYQDILARAEKTKFANKFTAEFFACDSTLVRLRERYQDPSLKLDLVSCQFAFHYSFESLSQAECMVRNAAECLQAGGYFIATIPDANEIMRRLQAAGTDARKFGNDVYSIDFACNTNPLPLFGGKYQFHLEGVVDCPEFLVYFPLLLKLCRKYGLKLVRRTTFADYYKETLPQGRQLLQRMSGLESVLHQRCDNDDQYAHIRNTYGNRGRPIGTLSKSEWEATTLYLVCAFKKCKNTWDPNGRPLFNFDD